MPVDGRGACRRARPGMLSADIVYVPGGIAVATRRHGSGHAEFAAFMLLIGGILNVTAGVAALVQKDYFSETGLLYENLALWAWLWTLWGVLQLGVSYLIYIYSPIGRILGIFLASVSIVTWFLSMGAHPAWSLFIMALDIVAVYALVVERGFEE